MFTLFAIYVGPDQVMPVMSVLATIMGALLIFWSKVVAVFRKIFKLNKHDQAAAPVATSTPNAANPNDPAK